MTPSWQVPSPSLSFDPADAAHLLHRPDSRVVCLSLRLKSPSRDFSCEFCKPHMQSPRERRSLLVEDEKSAVPNVLLIEASPFDRLSLEVMLSAPHTRVSRARVTWKRKGSVDRQSGLRWFSGSARKKEQEINLYQFAGTL